MRASIIIPVYKAEDFIGDCLTSILGQTVTDFEVICVDDGSPDGSAEVVEGFVRDDPRVRLIRQENGGASSARNAGFDAAHADYVTFVDADDEISSDFLERLLAAAERDEADIAVANKTIVLPSGRTKPKSPVLKDKRVRGGDHRRHKLLPHIAPHAKLIRRSFLTEHGIRFHEGITYEDYIYWLECLTKDPLISQVSDFLYSYKKNPQSISAGAQRLRAHNSHSRVTQTIECLRIAEESGIPGFAEKVTQNQLENSVMRHITAMAVSKDRVAAQEAFQIFSEGLRPLEETICLTLTGWRRLMYKILLEGDLEDLTKLRSFVHDRASLRTWVDASGPKPNLYVARDELPSIAHAKGHFFNVADLIR